jgi:hypothetical protein
MFGIWLLIINRTTALLEQEEFLCFPSFLQQAIQLKNAGNSKSLQNRISLIDRPHPARQR